MEKTYFLAVGVCGGLKTNNSVVNMLVMVKVGWLYIPTECYLVCPEVSSHCEVCCCLHAKQIVYKHLNT